MTTPNGIPGPQRIRDWLRSQGDQYRKGAERPLGGYVLLMGVYSGATVGAAGVAKLLGRRASADFSPWTITQLALATHKISRLIAKDPVTSPIRVPFTTYQGTSAPSELTEEVRGHGVQHSVGELLTCPMCLGQWIATAFTAGLVLAPVPTRLVMATFSGVAGADFLHHAYAWLQQASEQD